MAKNLSAKKILATLCAFCLVAVSCFTGLSAATTAFADTPSVPNPSNPTHLTLSDVDMSNITDENHNTNYTYAPGFDNTLFSFYMSCNSSYGRIYFAGNGNYSGFCIVYESNGTVSLQDACTDANLLGYSTVNIDPATVGIESFLTDEVLYQFETHYLDLDAGGTKNDARLTLYINGIQVATAETFNRVDRLGNHFFTSGGLRNFRSHSETEHERRDAYEKWTFKDLGIADGEKVSMTGSMVGPLDGSMFVGKINFPTTSFGNLYIGYDDWYGLCINASGSDGLKLFEPRNNKTIATLDPSTAGATLRGNDNLTLGISIDFFDADIANGTTKLKIGVWINGELYNGNYFKYGSVKIADYLRRIHTYSMSGVVVASVATTTSLAVPEFDSFTVADTSPTFSNANVNTGNFTGTIPADSLDEQIFTLKVKYSANSQQFHYAGTDDTSVNDYKYSGFTLYPANSGATLCLRQMAGSVVSNFVNADYNAEDIFGEGGSFFNEFILQISTEFVDVDNDGSEDDVKLGVWFNGSLGNGHYLYYVDAAAGLGNSIYANEVGAPKLYSYYEELPAELSTYEEWTYSDVDCADGTVASTWVFTPVTGETLDKTVFHGYVTFTGGDQYLMLGSSKSYNGYGFTTASDDTILNFRLLVGGAWTNAYTLNATELGLSSFHNTKMELEIASRILKDNGDGTYLVEVFPMINGVLPRGKSWTLNINKAKFTRSLGLANPMVLESIAASHTNTVPAGFTKLTLNDLGINKDIANYITSGYYPGSWDETVLSMNINFGTWTSHVRYAKGDGGYSGVCLYRDGDNLKFGADYTPLSSYLTNVIITPASLGYESFDNVRLAVNFVTDYIDLDCDGSEDDIKVGCFINGVLAGGHYLYGYDAVSSMGHGFGINQGWVAELSEIAVPARTMYETNYDFYTLNNAGINDGTGVSYGILKNSAGADVEGTSYDALMFGARIKFVTTGARMHYAASDDSQFSGIQLRLLGDGTLTVEPYSGKLNYTTIIIDPAQFELETFANTEFTLKITTDIVDANGSGDTDDVKVGFWINDILANNRYLYIMDQADDLGRNVNFNEGDDTVRRSLWDIEAPNDGTILYYQIATGHPYLVTADYMVNTRGDRFDNGDEVLTAGDYTAYYEENGSLLEAEHTIVLWRDWDICPDEGLNILDLIGLKKLNAAAESKTGYVGYRPPTLAGQMAAVNRVGAANLTTLCNHLLGRTLITETYTYTYAKSDANGLVMPIGAWISPTTYPARSAIGTDLAGYGIETNFLQEKYYDMIDDLGVNQLTYTEKNFGDSGSSSILKGLGLAENHGLTVFVDDSGIGDDETDETALAERVNAYSRYASFGGIHIGDEPHTSTYQSSATTKTVSEIADKSTLINSYTNLLGYVNLYGDYTLNNTQYKAYLAEAISELNPKVLSFDHYNGTTSNNGAISYFGSLEAIREASLTNDIPFIGFISTGDDYTPNAIYTDDDAPTPEQIKWNVNTLLAYGAKGYNWFTLIQPWYFALEGDGEIEGMDFDRCGLIGANGEPTRNYDVAQEINTYVATIDHILMASTSVDVLAVGTSAQSQTGISKTSYNGTTVSAGNASTGAIVGVFDYNGKTAYYVVNHNTNASQNITLNFGSSQSIRVYTESGNTTTTASSQVLSLGAGEAALVVVG